MTSPANGRSSDHDSRILPLGIRSLFALPTEPILGTSQLGGFLMNRVLLTMALMLLSSAAAFADTHYHLAVDGMP